jgi:hypothetical protein
MPVKTSLPPTLVTTHTVIQPKPKLGMGTDFDMGFQGRSSSPQSKMIRACRTLLPPSRNQQLCMGRYFESHNLTRTQSAHRPRVLLAPKEPFMGDKFRDAIFLWKHLPCTVNS